MGGKWQMEENGWGVRLSDEMMNEEGE